MYKANNLGYFSQKYPIYLVALESITHCSKNKDTIIEQLWVWIKHISLDLGALQ